MGAETALRRYTDTLECLLLGLAASLGDVLCSLENTGFHLLLILELRDLGANDTHDDVLVLGKELEGLETAGALGIILEVERVDVEVLEELLRDDVVRTLGEVATPDEVAAAQVNTGVHVFGKLAYCVVVQSNVGIKEVFDGTFVVLVLLPALAELLRAEVCERLAIVSLPDSAHSQAMPGSSN